MSGNFLWHYLFPVYTRTFPLGSMVLCVVPTFLLPFKQEAIERTVVTAKVQKMLKLTTFDNNLMAIG